MQRQRGADRIGMAGYTIKSISDCDGRVDRASYQWGMLMLGLCRAEGLWERQRRVCVGVCGCRYAEVCVRPTKFGLLAGGRKARRKKRRERGLFTSSEWRETKV
jgi:hypothetical protein